MLTTCTDTCGSEGCDARINRNEIGKVMSKAGRHSSDTKENPPRGDNGSLGPFLCDVAGKSQ